jgi:uncharacterized protein YcbK (DUF882 family)
MGEMVTWNRGDEDVYLTKNFKRSEFECGCGKCKEQKMSPELLMKLQIVRDEVGREVNCNSGYRCESWNKHEKGSKGSRHILGWAADIWVKDMNPIILGAIAASKGLRVGCYKHFVHVDIDLNKNHFIGDY